MFVISDAGIFGIQAWLNSYYDIKTKYIHYDELKLRGGSIQAALNIEINDPKANKYLVKLEGANGQMPNLDLFNTIIRICHGNNFACGLDKIPVSIQIGKRPCQCSVNRFRQQGARHERSGPV